MEEQEKNNIQDAEIEQTDQEQKEQEKKNYRTEVILIFVIGALLGVMIKAEAIKRISIGFSDYKVITRIQEYDIEQIEKRLIEESAQETDADVEAVETEEGTVE